MNKQVSKHKSQRFRRFTKANEAVSALEYAILVGVIAVGVGGALITFSNDIEKALENVGAGVKAIKATPDPDSK